MPAKQRLTRRRRRNAPTEAVFLRNNIAGGDAALLGFYTVRAGLTLSGSEVTSWADARGASGFGPALPRFTTGPTRVGSNDVDYTLNTASPGTFLLSGMPAAWDGGAGPVTVVVVADTTAADSNAIVSIDAAVTTNGQMSIMASVGGTEPGRTGAKYDPSATLAQVSRRYPSARRRLLILTRNGTAASVQAPPYPAVSSTVTAAAAAMTRFWLGNGAGGVHIGKYRAVLILNRVATAADVTLLTTWAQRYHSAVSNGPKMIVFDGDSITNNLAATNHWGDVVMESSGFTTYDDVNLATDSASIRNDGGGNNLLGRTASFDAYYSGTRSKNIAVIFAGTNDFALLSDSEATVFANLKTWCIARKALGFKVAVCTMLARNVGAPQATFNANRAAYNTDIRTMVANGWADAIIDFAADSAWSADDAYTNLTIYSGDGIHPTVAGYAALAVIAQPVLAAL